MKNKTHILILIIMLLVIPTSTVFACGNSSVKHKTEKMSCSKQDNKTEKKSCCDIGQKDDDGCSGDCNNTSCHCPSVVNISVLFNDFEVSNSNNFKLLANEWTYLQHNPKAIYLPIWQPPKIG